jgi:hypothetical protein
MAAVKTREHEIEVLPESDEVSWVLERAADALLRHGWTTGVTFDPSGSMCVRGAILRASENREQSLHDHAEDRLGRYLGVDSVVAWNDGTCGSMWEAMRALRAAAAAA